VIQAGVGLVFVVDRVARDTLPTQQRAAKQRGLSTRLCLSCRSALQMKNANRNCRRVSWPPRRQSGKTPNFCSISVRHRARQTSLAEFPKVVGDGAFPWLAVLLGMGWPS
jgi:hypothetical protein